MTPGPIFRPMRPKALFPVVSLFVLILTIATGGSAPAQIPTQDCPGNDARAVLCTLLADPSHRLPLSPDQLANLREFYAARNFEPAWNGPQAQAALNALANADADGLDPLDYRPASASAESPVERDLLLTSAVLRYVHDLRFGRVPASERGDFVDLPVPTLDLPRELGDAIDRGNVGQFLAVQRPADPQYRRLAEALARYREQGDSQHADTVIANMERWRWMPRPLESRYIMANEAASDLVVMDGGSVVLTSRVIAGKPKMPSPIMRADVHGVIVNPPWNVPPNIARREILPKGRHYLRAHGFVWRGNGQIQQRPGPRSALGRVKLDMPNGFNVYLHDTPGKAMFARDNRNLSHGCIRVQAILPLAGIVVAGDADADSGEERVKDAIAGGATREIMAQADIPAYFAYWTAVADDSGDVHFFPDVYGRDSRLLAALHRSTATRVSFEDSGQ